MIGMNKSNLVVRRVVSGLFALSASQCSSYSSRKSIGNPGQSAASAVGGRVQNRSSVGKVANGKSSYNSTVKFSSGGSSPEPVGTEIIDKNTFRC